MTVIECVPLAGQGLLARRGGLVVLTHGRAPGPTRCSPRWPRSPTPAVTVPLWCWPERAPPSSAAGGPRGRAPG